MTLPFASQPQLSAQCTVGTHTSSRWAGATEATCPGQTQSLPCVTPSSTPPALDLRQPLWPHPAPPSPQPGGPHAASEVHSPLSPAQKPCPARHLFPSSSVAPALAFWSHPPALPRILILLRRNQPCLIFFKNHAERKDKKGAGLSRWKLEPPSSPFHSCSFEVVWGQQPLGTVTLPLRRDGWRGRRAGSA